MIEALKFAVILFSAGALLGAGSYWGEKLMTWRFGAKVLDLRVSHRMDKDDE